MGYTNCGGGRPLKMVSARFHLFDLLYLVVALRLIVLYVVVDRSILQVGIASAPLRHHLDIRY